LDLEAMVTVNKGAINYSKFHVLRAVKAHARVAA
ncbi:single-stranded DNA-binding protein, partial [Xanthomonas vasicola pv. vasculorum]